MNNNFSENLKKIRKDNNLSQEDLAEQLGVSRQAISKWESGIAYPEMDKIIALCTKFNLNIDDLLYKDIREVKGEEDAKKNLNKYIDDFLNFITNTINLFCNMRLKSKIKCLFEQVVLGFVLFGIFAIIGVIAGDLLSGVFGFIPEKIYFIFSSIINLIYVVFSIIVSVMIMLHIFKTRYLDYYEKIKLESNVELKEESIDKQEEISEEKKEVFSEEKNTEKKNKVLFKRNENKIIIRDPKHSEYKFFNGISKIIVSITKFFAICFGTIFFALLIGLVFCLVVSFLIYKTGLFFIGLLISIIALAIIDIDCILLILNFVFNRKNDKKKIIWSFILSLVLIGAGIGLVSIGTLNLDYVGEDNSQLKTDYIEFEMNDDLFFDLYYYLDNVEYVESNINNVKVEYQINNLCDVDYHNDEDGGVHLWSECTDLIKVINKIIDEINDKKIVSVNSEIKSLKFYASKDNIEKLKSNREEYYKEMGNSQINEYERQIAELEEQNQEYFNQINEYEQEIANLEAELFEYQLVE